MGVQKTPKTITLVVNLTSVSSEARSVGDLSFGSSACHSSPPIMLPLVLQIFLQSGRVLRFNRVIAGSKFDAVSRRWKLVSVPHYEV